MRSKSVLHMLFTVLFAVAMPAAFAQKTSDIPAMPKYDVTKEVKVKGVIEDVKEMTMANHPSESKAGLPGTPAKGEVGIHLMVKTATETIEVRLCPSGYLKDFEVAFSKGQQVEVTGSRVKVDDKEVILAREVVQGNNTVTLRDSKGAPVWTWLKKD